MMWNDISLCKKYGESATVTATDLLAVLALTFLNLLPIIGPILYLVLSVRIADCESTAPSIRSCIQAILVFHFSFVAVGLILVLRFV